MEPSGAAPKFDLAHFGLKDMTECGREIRQLHKNAKSMEETANRITQYFYDQMIDKDTGRRACALVRLFKTHTYKESGPELQRFAKALMPEEKIKQATKCMVLLSTAGDSPQWNSRHSSQGHKAIPLISKEQVQRQLPMIYCLIKQMGLAADTVIHPDKRLLLDIAQRKFDVFYVPEASSSSQFIPFQQDFVIPYNIKSVLGMGGVLPSGNIFSVLMFSKVHITGEAADLFRTLALDVKIALMPFENSVFAKAPSQPGNTAKSKGKKNEKAKS